MKQSTIQSRHRRMARAAVARPVARGKSLALARLIDATAFAAEQHRMQRREDADASPYINHPIALARVLAVEGGVTDVVALMAALLHDTIEDTRTTPDDLRLRFGRAVAAAVMEVTDDKKLPKAERKRLQIEHAPTLSRPARLVKLADKICNLRDIAARPPQGWSRARQRRYFDWSRRVIDALRGTHARLEKVYDEAYASRP